MTEWNNFYDKIIQEVDRLQKEGCELPFFRGENNKNNPLLPTLFRENVFKNGIDIKTRDLKQLEMNLFIEYESFSAIHQTKNPSSRNSWEILYEMRHHSIPTRLLDWSTSFSVALYFAIKNNVQDPCIWILNPLELNFRSDYHMNKILNIAAHRKYDYVNSFLKPPTDPDYSQPFKNPIAIFPLKNHPRLIAQSGFFTVHGINIEPINKICPTAVKRFEIPYSIMTDIKKNLKITNVNEYSLYPDLDGLARYLKEEYQLT
jgi:hypothetical protein